MIEVVIGFLFGLYLGLNTGIILLLIDRYIGILHKCN
jgi:hypothetical protein